MQSGQSPASSAGSTKRETALVSGRLKALTDKLQSSLRSRGSSEVDSECPLTTFDNCASICNVMERKDRFETVMYFKAIFTPLDN